jgi:outer membrane receptor protein involved in Fe transport
MKKDGFARFVPMDPITMSRVDIIKGPGGALYGQNGTGGVVNVSSVLAGNRPVARLGTSFGSYDFRRTEFLGPVRSFPASSASPCRSPTRRTRATRCITRCRPS